jgi:hypothetical protein
MSYEQTRRRGRRATGIAIISNRTGAQMKLRIAYPVAVARRLVPRPRLLALSAASALAVTAATALAPAGPAALAFSDFNPAITVADGNSVIAVHTGSDGLRFYWNEFGTNNWHGEQVAADGTTFSDPAIAQIGNTVVIAAEGIFNSLDLYWQTNGASGWNMETVAGIQTTYSAPSLAQNGNTTIIAAQGPSNSLDFYWAFNGSSNWGPELVAGAGTTYSAPSIAANISGNGVNIAAEGPSNSLDFYWAINGTATWYPDVVAGADSVGGAPAISAHDNGVNIVALNYGGFESTFYWAFNGNSTWTASKMPGGDDTASSIVAYPGNPGGVHVVAGELFGYMDVSTNVNGSGTWTSVDVIQGAPSAPGKTAGNPSITMNDGSVNIAVEGEPGDLWFFWQDSSGAFHQETVDTSANLS